MIKRRGRSLTSPIKSSSPPAYLKIITPLRIRRQASPELTKEDLVEPLPLSTTPTSKASKLFTQSHTRVFPLSITPVTIEKRSSKVQEVIVKADIPTFLQGFLEGVRPHKKHIKSVVDSYRVSKSKHDRPFSREETRQWEPHHSLNRSIDIPKVAYSYYKEMRLSGIQPTDCYQAPQSYLYKRQVISMNPRSKLAIYSTNDDVRKIKPKTTSNQRKVIVPKATESVADASTHTGNPANPSQDQEETLAGRLKA